MVTQPNLYGHLSDLLLFDLESKFGCPFLSSLPSTLSAATGTKWCSLIWELMTQSSLAKCSNGDDWTLSEERILFYFI